MKTFANGIFFNEKRENAPDFVLGGIDIKPNDLIEWLNTQTPNQKGYVKLDILKSKAGKPYIAVNDYVSKQDISKL